MKCNMVQRAVLDAAEEQYLRSLELMEKNENRPGIAQQCESLGDVYLKKEDFDKAEDHFMRASDLYEEMKEQASIQEVQDKLMFIFSQPKYLENRKQALREGLKKPEAEKDYQSMIHNELVTSHINALEILKGSLIKPEVKPKKL